MADLTGRDQTRDEPARVELTGAETEAEREERLRHGSSFGAAAAAYAGHRPGYPDAAVRWALEPVRARRHPRVLDLAAGTGKLTAALISSLAGPLAGSSAGLGAEVIAVEPDPAMLAQLRCTLPTVQAMSGRAEAIPLPGRSVDAVVSGQAMHWFDMDRAVPEIARVLRPGGVLARVPELLIAQPETARGEFVLPMVTVAVRATRW